MNIYLGFFCLVTILTFYFESEFKFLKELNSYMIYENYFEALFNQKMNDFYSLYVSYYIIVGIEFILMGLLLLFASLICVNLNKFNKNFKLNNFYDLFTIFDFFFDFINFFFLRKQNLVDQENNPSATKIFKKKTVK